MRTKTFEHAPPRPGHTYVIATERESGEPVIIGTFGMEFKGYDLFRKRSKGWYEKGRWERGESAWRCQWEAEKSPFLTDARYLTAKTEEEAINEYIRTKNN